MTVIENIDVEIEKKVEKLREKFTNEMDPKLYENDFVFYRFLKARDFNINQAEIMLKKHLEWRKTFQIDSILTQEVIPKELEQYFLQIKIGVSKDQSPVRYIAIGNMDLKGIRKSVKFIDRMRFVVRLLEENVALLEQKSKECGKYLNGYSFIIDMENLSFMNATDKANIEDAIAILKIFQDNYPERLKSMIVINASSYFAIAFAMLKNFIPEVILNKIHVYGSEEEWKPVLLETISADLLPKFLGGKREDKNEYPLCEAFAKHKGVVHSHFFNCKSSKSLAKCKDVKKLIIPRASFNEIKLIVKEAGSVIEWEFETKTRDIGFGLFHSEIGKDGEEKITELVPLLRLDTEEFSETGMYKCEKSGTYVILFDNSYSWVRAKEIYYRANVVSPQDHEKEMNAS